MNLIIVFERDFVGPDSVVLRGYRHQHVTGVLKSSPGDILKVGCINGPTGHGRVVEISAQETRMEVVCEHPPPGKIPLTVIAALPRPLVFRRIVSSLTAMGVARMMFIQTARVEKSYWKSPALGEDALMGAVVSGLEQSHDTVVPEIAFVKQFKPFVENELSGILGGRRGWLAHPGRGIPCPSNVADESVLAMGPEGGLTDDEVGQFCARGFQTVHLGPRILRVETAVQALAGRLMPVSGIL